VARVRFHGSLPKGTRQSENEDFYNRCVRKGCFAISDGASVSFDSAGWARTLACEFCKSVDLSLSWLDNAIAIFNAKYDRDAMVWYKQASFDRGSFATLLGIELSLDGQLVSVVGVGDSVAILVDGMTFIDAFPLAHSSKFDNAPQLIGSLSSMNDFIVDGKVSGACLRDWDISALTEPVIFCMTDALAQWFLTRLEDGLDPVSTLTRIATLKEFNQFVEGERRRTTIRRDDTTLLVISPRER
jgi:hypothetical protein